MRRKFHSRKHRYVALEDIWGDRELWTIALLPLGAAEVAELRFARADDVVAADGQLYHVMAREAPLPALLLAHGLCHIVQIIRIRTRGSWMRG